MNTKQKRRRDVLMKEKVAGPGLGCGPGKKGPEMAPAVAAAQEPEAEETEGEPLTDLSDNELTDTVDVEDNSCPATDNFEADFNNAQHGLTETYGQHGDGVLQQAPGKDYEMNSAAPVPKKKKRSCVTDTSSAERETPLLKGNPVRVVKAKTCLNREEDFLEIKRQEAVVRLRIAEEELRCAQVKTKIVLFNKKAMREIMDNQIDLSLKQSVI